MLTWICLLLASIRFLIHFNDSMSSLLIVKRFELRMDLALCKIKILLLIRIALGARDATPFPSFSFYKCKIAWSGNSIMSLWRWWPNIYISWLSLAHNVSYKLQVGNIWLTRSQHRLFYREYRRNKEKESIISIQTENKEIRKMFVYSCLTLRFGI